MSPTTWSRACEVFPHWRHDAPDRQRISRTCLSLERDVSDFSRVMFTETGRTRAATRQTLRGMIPQLRVFRRLVLEAMRERAEQQFMQAAE